MIEEPFEILNAESVDWIAPLKVIWLPLSIKYTPFMWAPDNTSEFLLKRADPDVLSPVKLDNELKDVAPIFDIPEKRTIPVPELEKSDSIIELPVNDNCEPLEIKKLPLSTIAVLLNFKTFIQGF